MKKTLAIIAMLLVAALLLCSCGNKENNGEKKLTARDIEGRWTVDYIASSTPKGDLAGLEGFLVSTRVNDNAVVIFKDGKITAEWEAEDGKKTSELGGYEVNEGYVFINSIKAEPKLEGKTLTLTDLTSETVIILEKK